MPVITTNDADLADKCIKTRNYGQRATYYSVMMGRNSRMDEIRPRSCAKRSSVWMT